MREVPMTALQVAVAVRRERVGDVIDAVYDRVVGCHAFAPRWAHELVRSWDEGMAERMLQLLCRSDEALSEFGV